VVEFVEGELLTKGEEFVVLKCGPFGVRVLVPRRTAGKLEGKVKLYTELHLLQEGEPILYGFESPQERELFRKLVKIPKVGAKVALSILSEFEPQEFKRIVESGDYRELSRVKGLGKKLSQRVVLEMKGKLEEESELPGELLLALRELGYTKSEVKEALKGINLTGLPLEEALKEALKHLSGRLD
jgi:Holliday junction DNA helicase RuvA